MVAGRAGHVALYTLMRSRLLAAVLVLLAAPAAAAADDLDGLVEAVNRAGAAPTTEATLATIARAVDLAPPALRAEQAQAGLPWGDVFVSHRIATRGGHPLAKVFAARRTGASWKEIAEEAGVDAALLARDLAAAFPGLTPAAPRPVTAPPPVAAPPAPPAPAPEKKPGLAQRFLDLFRGTPDREATGDWETERTQEEIRERILRGGGRR